MRCPLCGYLLPGHPWPRTSRYRVGFRADTTARWLWVSTPCPECRSAIVVAERVLTPGLERMVREMARAA